MTELTTTERGFAILDFEYHDYDSVQPRHFTVQESSLATEHKIWIGPATPQILQHGEQSDEVLSQQYSRAHLNEVEARQVRDAIDRLLGDLSQIPETSNAYLAALAEAERRWPGEFQRAQTFAVAVEWALAHQDRFTKES